MAHRTINIGESRVLRVSTQSKPIPVADFDWLCTLITSESKSGNRFRPNDTIQIGWTICRLQTESSRALRLCEPDWHHLPITWIPTCDRTLIDLRLQRDIADSVGLLDDIAFPTIRQSAIIGNDVDESCSSFVLERCHGVENDSGWFVGKRDSQFDYDNPENLRRASLYEVGIRCPLIVMYLALPFGTRIEIGDNGTRIYVNGGERSVRPSSLLGALRSV